MYLFLFLLEDAALHGRITYVGNNDEGNIYSLHSTPSLVVEWRQHQSGRDGSGRKPVRDRGPVLVPPSFEEP